MDGRRNSPPADRIRWDGAKNVLVGDLWVLAGQSNMEGCGKRVDMEESMPLVHSLQSCEEWALAEEPLHWLCKSPRLVHHKILGRDAVPNPWNPVTRTGLGGGPGPDLRQAPSGGDRRSGRPHSRRRTAGRPCSSGVRTCKPAGGGSLYGATLERVRLVGGSVAGILWYQGRVTATPPTRPNTTPA